jgi:hypothetical protein
MGIQGKENAIIIILVGYSTRLKTQHLIDAMNLENLRYGVLARNALA